MTSLETIAKVIWSPTADQEIMKAEGLLDRMDGQVSERVVAHICDKHFAGDWSKALANKAMARLNVEVHRKRSAETQHANALGNGFDVAKAWGNPASEQTPLQNPAVEKPSDAPRLNAGDIPWPAPWRPEVYNEAVKFLMARGFKADEAHSELFRQEKAARAAGMVSTQDSTSTDHGENAEQIRSNPNDPNRDRSRQPIPHGEASKSAYGQLMARAHNIRKVALATGNKPLTEAQAFVKALELNPDLARQERAERERFLLDRA